MTVTVAHYQYERVDEWLRTCLPGATRNDALTEACAKTSFVAKVIRITGAESPEELPAYTAVRAAQIVRLSPSTLRLWASGDGEHNALFAPAQDSPLTLSFSNLVESFVLASMRRVHGVSMQRVRKALTYVGKKLGVQRPLIHARFRTDGVRLFVDHANQLLEVSSEGQAALREILDASLERIEWGREVAARLYPWVRADLHGAQPKSIVIDPRRGFGQPIIAGTGIEARIVTERYRAGESVAELAQDYRLDAEKIEDAIRCETSEAA
ncbi:MAG: DUF433 domain-containing protein [Deltaproteobacteria bacterium]|nr:MAG: DUF433 domain-containing protein [Deltaproteobacteria bacterium]